MSLTNRTVLLPQLRDSSHHVSETKCPPNSTHLLLLHGVDSTSSEPSMQTTIALMLKYEKFKPQHNRFWPIAFCCKWSFTHLLILSIVFHILFKLNGIHPDVFKDEDIRITSVKHILFILAWAQVNLTAKINRMCLTDVILVSHTFNPKHLKKILLMYTSTCSPNSTSVLKLMWKKTQTHLSQSG